MRRRLVEKRLSYVYYSGVADSGKAPSWLSLPVPYLLVPSRW